MSYLPPTFAARPDLSFDFDLYCLDCRYNLRGLTRDAKCPECGKPVVATLATDLLYLADAGWLSRLITGYLVLLIAVWTPPLFLMLLLFGRGERTWPLAAFHAGMLLLAVGGWLITTAEPHRVDATAARLRLATRAALALTTACLVLSNFAGTLGAIAGIAFFVFLALSLAALLVRTATLARRMICPTHARISQAMAIAVFIALLLFVPALIVNYLHADAGDVWLVVVSCVGTLSFFILFPAFLVLFHQVRASLIAARRYARYITPSEDPHPEPAS